MCNHSRQARREERFLRREEKFRRRQEKLRLKAERHAIRHGLRNLRRNSDPAIIHFHPSSILPTSHTFNYYYQYRSQMPGVRQTTQLRPMDPVQVEEMVATLRTMFPDCDPQYIRNCLSQETSNHVQKVADKLMESSYPKIIITSSAPSAPQLPLVDGEFESDPPSYEEATIRPELAGSTKNERPVSWGGSPNKDSTFNAHTNNNTSSRSQPSTSTSTRNDAAMPSTSSTSTSSSTFTSRYSPAIKSVRRMAGMGPATVQQVCDTYSSTLTRPVPIHFTQTPPPTFTQPFIIIPKDGTTIQKGFPIHSYPTPALESHDISYQDWVNFIKGLNMLVGVSNSSDSSILGSLSANLRLMVIGNNDRQMEEYVGMVNEYLGRWNDGFFRPRRMEMEFVSKKAVKNGSVNIFKNKSDCVQYLLVKST